jgi:hypothetical protein
VGVKFSVPLQTGSEGHPASYTMGAGYFPGVKRPGCGFDHPASSSNKVIGRVELYLCFPSGPLWPVLGVNFIYTVLYHEEIFSLHVWLGRMVQENFHITVINTLNTKLNPICHLLALLGAHHILHVNRIRINEKLYREATSLIKVTDSSLLGCHDDWQSNRRFGRAQCLNLRGQAVQKKKSHPGNFNTLNVNLKSRFLEIFLKIPPRFCFPHCLLEVTIRMVL